MGWEDVALVIFGPRQGKSTSLVIPMIVSAPGTVITTSNKRDVVDATREPRGRLGRVWIFDPQRIANEPPSWWWNPLSYVTDVTKARDLAKTFADASRPDDNAQTDAYFDPAGRNLLAAMLFAAALGGRPITQVYTWLTRVTDDEPAAILRSHNQPLMADAVEGVINAAPDQRSGVYGTAGEMVAFLLNDDLLRWITPPAAQRDELRPDDFVRQPSDTMYLLSREGRGSAGPVLSALTVALTDAAERFAATQRGGRLPVPLVVVLDEAANVFKWAKLPAMYSNYGSRGIIVMTILQAWSQGDRVWGKAGMLQLWSASTIRIIGSVVGEQEFLGELSRMVGEYPITTETFSTQGGLLSTRSRSTQVSWRPILDPAELAALPKGRALVFPAGGRAALMQTVPWMQGPQARAIQASIERHDPQPSQTLHEMQQEAS